MLDLSCRMGQGDGMMKVGGKVGRGAQSPEEGHHCRQELFSGSVVVLSTVRFGLLAPEL